MLEHVTVRFGSCVLVTGTEFISQLQEVFYWHKSFCLLEMVNINSL
jgi:hypothetical protein